MFASTSFASQAFASSFTTQETPPQPTPGEGVSLNDVKIAKLRQITGKTGPMGDLINENVYWRALGGTGLLSLNDVKKFVLSSLGYTGALNDMEKKYWEEL